jgi:hypothetical protein
MCVHQIIERNIFESGIAALFAFKIEDFSLFAAKVLLANS